MNRGVTTSVVRGGYKGLLISILICSITVLGTVFCALPTHSANNAKVSVSVKEGCNVTATGTEHTSSLTPGTSGNIGTGSKFTITCNDPNGYVVYAVGSSKGDDGVEAEGNTNLLGVSHGNKIMTSLNKSGEASSWQFKLTNPTGGLIINTEFGKDYNKDSVIPSVRTKVASKDSTTTASNGDSFTANYSAYISPAQVADAYNGKVKYILFHPSSNNAQGEPKPSTPPETMQSFGNYCDFMKQDEILELRDIRDDSTYKIARLKDGQCWMIENLRLMGTFIDSEDSDMESGSLMMAPSNIDNFASSFNAEGLDSLNAAYLNEPYGGLYSWPLATAGTGRGLGRGDNATGSICPKGWRLPTGGSNGDFMNLAIQYGYSLDDEWGGNEWMQEIQNNPVPNFVCGGVVASKTIGVTGSGTRGAYWTSTIGARYEFYDDIFPLSFSNSGTAYYGDTPGNTIPDMTGFSIFGLAVRCIAR